MNLSMDVIEEYLRSKSYDIVSLDLQNGVQKNYGLPILYMENEKLEDDSLYIASAENLPRNPYLGMNTALISIGTPPDAYNVSRCSLLILDEKTDILKLYSSVIDIYRLFDRWLLELDELYKKNAPLQAYLDLSYPYVNNAITVHDPTFNTLAFVPKIIDGQDFLDLISEVSPEWIVNNHRVDMTQTEPYLTSYIYKNETHETLMNNLFEDEALLAIINISDTLRPIRRSDRVFLAQLSKRLKKALLQNQEILQKKMKSFRRTLSDLLEGIYVDPHELKRSVKRAGFSDNDKWMIVHLKFAEDYVNRMPMTGIIHQIRRQIPAMTSLQYNSDFVLLIDITLCGGNADVILKIITETIPSDQCIAGSSNVFFDLADSKPYYDQAKIAADYVSRTAPARKICCFEECAADHLLHYGDSVLPAELVCEKGILEMFRKDKGSGNYLCETLYTAFKNHLNTTHTARDLYIHRSTLLYRLDRIRQFIDLDTKDFDQLLYMQQSLALLMKKGDISKGL